MVLAVYVRVFNRLDSEHVERNAISYLGGTHEYVHLHDHPECLSSFAGVSREDFAGFAVLGIHFRVVYCSLPGGFL